MAESPRRVDLRLTIPASSPFLEIAADLAEKFAEYAGVSKGRVADVAGAVRAALAETSGASVEIDMAAQGDELVLTTNPGPSSIRRTFPRSD